MYSMAAIVPISIFTDALTSISLKLFLIIVFLWIASPVSSHLIARLEVTTKEDEGCYDVKKLGDLEEGE